MAKLLALLRHRRYKKIGKKLDIFINEYLTDPSKRLIYLATNLIPTIRYSFIIVRVHGTGGTSLMTALRMMGVKDFHSPLTLMQRPASATALHGSCECLFIDRFLPKHFVNKILARLHQKAPTIHLLRDPLDVFKCLLNYHLLRASIPSLMREDISKNIANYLAFDIEPNSYQGSNIARVAHIASPLMPVFTSDLNDARLKPTMHKIARMLDLDDTRLQRYVKEVNFGNAFSLFFPIKLEFCGISVLVALQDMVLPVETIKAEGEQNLQNGTKEGTKEGAKNRASSTKQGALDSTLCEAFYRALEGARDASIAPTKRIDLHKRYDIYTALASYEGYYKLGVLDTATMPRYNKKHRYLDIFITKDNLARLGRLDEQRSQSDVEALSANNASHSQKQDDIYIYIYQEIQGRLSHILSRIEPERRAEAQLSVDDAIDYIVEYNPNVFYIMQSEVAKLGEVYADNALFLARLPREFASYYRLEARMRERWGI